MNKLISIPKTSPIVLDIKEEIPVEDIFEMKKEIQEEYEGEQEPDSPIPPVEQEIKEPCKKNLDKKKKVPSEKQLAHLERIRLKSLETRRQKAKLKAEQKFGGVIEKPKPVQEIINETIQSIPKQEQIKLDDIKNLIDTSIYNAFEKNKIERENAIQQKQYELNKEKELYDIKYNKAKNLLKPNKNKMSPFF